MKMTVMPIVVGALGRVPKTLEQRLRALVTKRRMEAI